MNLFWSIIYSIGILLIGYGWGSAVQEVENEREVHYLHRLIDDLREDEP